ncbi:MAG: DUF1186 domain-containing protein [Chloroflexota bacterium]
MHRIVKEFIPLSVEEIRATPPGKWGDFEMLDVIHHFSEQKDDKRTLAARELLLRSPEVSDMVDYSELFWEQVNESRHSKEFQRALQWAYASIAYNEQHEAGENREGRYRDLVEIYLESGDLETGFQIAARVLQMDPSDIWTYNVFGFALLHNRFSQLAIEVVTRGLQLTEHTDFDMLEDQFHDMIQRSQKKLDEEVDRTDEIAPDSLAAFRAALKVSTPNDKIELGYLTPISTLIEPGQQDQQTLHNEIIQQAKVYAGELIQLAFDERVKETGAPTRAVTLLRHFHQERLVELDKLASWLAQADGDWQSHLLSGEVGKIGGYTTDELKSIARDTGTYFYIRSGAIEALTERAERFPGERDNVVGFMRELLTRPEASQTAEEETFIGLLISEILDLGAKELFPEIEAAYAEDRVDTQIVGLDSFVEEWGMGSVHPKKYQEDGIELPLKCKECGRERNHFVQHVILDRNTEDKQKEGEETKYDPYVMDREIICPKCGSVDRYEMTPTASVRLMLPFDDSGVRRRKSGTKSIFQPSSRLQSMRSLVMGQPMHPLEGIDRYREEIAKQPTNAENHMKLGNLFRILHRHSDSLASYRRAYELDDQDSDVIITLAMAEHDFGNRERAKELYEDIKTLARKQTVPTEQMIENVGAAIDGLDALEENESSPWGFEEEEPSRSRPQRLLNKRADLKSKPKSKRKKPATIQKKLKKKKRKRKK